MENKKYFLIGFLFVVVVFGVFMFFRPSIVKQAQDSAPVAGPGTAPTGVQDPLAAASIPEKEWGAISETLNEFLQKNDTDKAISYLNEVLVKYPNFSLVSVKIAECYLHKKDLVKAEEYLKKAESSSQPNPFLSQVSAELYLQKNEYETAKKHASKVIELSSEDRQKAFGYYSFASIYLRTNDRPKAKENIDKALHLDPDNNNFKQLANQIDGKSEEKGANQINKKTEENNADGKTGQGNKKAEDSRTKTKAEQASVKPGNDTSKSK